MRAHMRSAALRECASSRPLQTVVVRAPVAGSARTLTGHRLAHNVQRLKPFDSSGRSVSNPAARHLCRSTDRRSATPT
jgi:hypothetical protein